MTANELQADRLIVYPCRGIRRKNIGEALLLASTLEPGEKLVLTAPPMTPSDQVLYARWKRVAERLRLPVIFEGQTLLGRTTVDFLRGASLCLTTSVTEGFGMAFLEPWLAGVSLAGAICRRSLAIFASPAWSFPISMRGATCRCRMRVGRRWSRRFTKR